MTLEEVLATVPPWALDPSAYVADAVVRGDLSAKEAAAHAGMDSAYDYVNSVKYQDAADLHRRNDFTVSTDAEADEM